MVETRRLWRPVEAIVAGPSDLEAGVGFLKGDGFRIAVAGEACGDVVGGVEEPSIACFGREEDKLVASVASGCPSLDVVNLVGESKPTAVAHSFARSVDRPLRGRGDGRLHQAVRRVPDLRLSLLRSHCHSRLSDSAVAAGAGRALLPRRRRCRRGQQGGAEPADERLPALGGSLCAQSFDPDRVGREGGAQGGPRPAVAPSDGATQRLWRLLHLQEHGARADLPRQPAEVSEQGPRITASSPVSAAASHTTTSMSATRRSGRWSCGWPRSSPSRPPIT